MKSLIVLISLFTSTQLFAEPVNSKTLLNCSEKFSILTITKNSEGMYQIDRSILQNRINGTFIFGMNSTESSGNIYARLTKKTNRSLEFDLGSGKYLNIKLAPGEKPDSTSVKIESNDKESQEELNELLNTDENSLDFYGQDACLIMDT